MGYREYARHRGCTLGAVQKAIEAGRITVVVDDRGAKKIDSEQADKAWDQNTDLAKQSLLHAPDSAAAGQTSEQSGEPDEDAPLPGDSDRYKTARAEREEIRRDSERLELQLKQGSLIDVDEAGRIAYTKFRALRDSLLNVPARVKDQCAAMKDPMEVELLLDRELSSVLASFDLASVTRERDDEDDDDATDQ